MRIGFDAFTLDLGTRGLTREDRKIHIAPKALEKRCQGVVRL